MTDITSVDAARQLRAIKWMIGGALAAVAIAGIVVLLVLVVIPNQQERNAEAAKGERCVAAMKNAPLGELVPDECRGWNGF
jgi:uncharacterized membrane protein